MVLLETISFIGEIQPIGVRIIVRVGTVTELIDLFLCIPRLTAFIAEGLIIEVSCLPGGEKIK
ncbi:hypothetical protein D3C76_1870020 [compost metagenome]